ncbi:MAG: DNA-binding protein [Bradymonadia bacterium]
MKRTRILIGLVVGITTACSPKNTTATPATESATSPATEVAGDRIVGKVVEAIEASGYTYVAVETHDGKKVWAAGPKTTISVGSLINAKKGTAMRSFKSKTLDRTFPVIYFLNSFELGEPVAKTASTAEAAAKTKTAPTSKPTSQPTSQPMVPTNHQKPKAQQQAGISVPKAPGGKTIAEVYAEAATLKDQRVKIRGKVVKFSGGIMGKNWLHIQDGTGDASLRTHDLTVTTDGTAKVGDTVLVEGVLRKDKDFGAGYKYAAIVEEATLTKE